MAVAAAAKKFRAPRIAIAGATGAVGHDLLRILTERGFPVGSLKLLASARSAGKTLDFRGETLTIEELTEDSFKDVDIALFSAGGAQSKRFAPAAVDAGALVIDNSSAFRMTDGVPLVVPEVNPDAAFEHKGIIANPNCSTIVSPVSRCVVSTYQAASGAGAAAMAELEQQARDWVDGKEKVTQDIFGRQYIWNLFSHNAPVDLETGYNEEETKMVVETKKIFNDPDFRTAVTCVRVPVLRAHCEAVNLAFDEDVPDLEAKARAAFADAPGVRIVDDREANAFPEPLLASNQDDILVGRIRKDPSVRSGSALEFFLAGDQVRKGAATNAVQIAELFLER
ncbi:asd [Symbiodinium sp. KB8]|nr:asd [Symbiodinium sp. KB8]